MGRDILSLKEFERNEFFHVFDVAEELEPIARERRNVDLLAEKTLVTAFYQPSTRTRLAHEAGMIRLGGSVTGFSDAKMTRAGDFYQESIKDTVKMLEFYGDVIVMRHFQKGAPHEAAKWASVPIINGGYERVLAAYGHAVAQGYRFFSYGDAMWLAPGSPADLPPSSSER
jgi:aspartate carbamoyltransferase catalytic subunit